ncbi:hypothetical protein R5R35_010436 [Gryllus longicercus]|uniref:Lysosome-associated membrane glycoprotein 2-like luminal domain-containing protein n=1 Tax=Gryllus longicercus TaxID=2509291 RepID=A0AAN9VYQ2_9ORTH
MVLLRRATLLLLLAGALLLAAPARARAQRDSGGAGGGVLSVSPAGDGDGNGDGDDGAEDGDGRNDVPGDDEDDAGGGADTTPRAPAPPQTETTTIPLEAAAQESADTSSKEEPVANPGRLPQYRLTNRGGETCILMEMDAVVGIFYEMKSKERRDLEEYVDDVEPTGFCKDDEAQLIIAWKAFELRWSFSKTPGGERWYVNLIELKYDKSDSTLFENASSVEDVTLSSRQAHGATLFPTPVGKSYHCQSEYKVELGPSSGHGSDSATLLLRAFRMQPFMFKPTFGPAFECSAGGAAKFRDETAPIAVGSTLAVVVLLTVTGYGVYRYFKIKKVQYDTME